MKHYTSYFELRRPDFARIMLDPAGLRKYLRKLLLRLRHHRARMVEQHGAGTGSALVECEDVAHRPKVNAINLATACGYTITASGDVP